MKSLVVLFGKSISYLIWISPSWFKLFLGDAFAILWWDVLRIRRKVVLENLQIAFPEMSSTEKNKIARESIRNMGRGLIEYFKLPFLNKDNYSQWIQFEGLETVDKALAAGKGVCLLAGHFGNGDFCLAGLSLRDYQCILISKHFKVAWINDVWFGLRSKFGTRFIEPRNSTSQILKALRSNEIVIFVQDQFMGPPIGCRVNFFGKETGSAMGLAMIARRTGAKVIPLYQYRAGGEQHVMRFEEEIPFEEKESKEDTIQFMTQKYTDFIEAKVKEDPKQWMWVHKRWKTFKGASQKKRHGVIKSRN
ncbi:MAG: lysophospholipid acyltransferase family protein [Bdellovibrionales bacterium]